MNSGSFIAYCKNLKTGKRSFVNSEDLYILRQLSRTEWTRSPLNETLEQFKIYSGEKHPETRTYGVVQGSYMVQLSIIAVAESEDALQCQLSSLRPHVSRRLSDTDVSIPLTSFRSNGTVATEEKPLRNVGGSGSLDHSTTECNELSVNKDAGCQKDKVQKLQFWSDTWSTGTAGAECVHPGKVLPADLESVGEQETVVNREPSFKMKYNVDMEPEFSDERVACGYNVIDKDSEADQSCVVLSNEEVECLLHSSTERTEDLEAAKSHLWDFVLGMVSAVDKEEEFQNCPLSKSEIYVGLGKVVKKRDVIDAWYKSNCFVDTAELIFNLMCPDGIQLYTVNKNDPTLKLIPDIFIEAVEGIMKALPPQSSKPVTTEDVKMFFNNQPAVVRLRLKGEEQENQKLVDHE